MGERSLHTREVAGSKPAAPIARIRLHRAVSGLSAVAGARLSEAASGGEHGAGDASSQPPAQRWCSAPLAEELSADRAPREIAGPGIDRLHAIQVRVNVHVGEPLAQRVEEASDGTWKRR